MRIIRPIISVGVIRKKAGEVIALRQKRAALKAAPYDVVNTSSALPTAGRLHIPPSGLTLRLHRLDKNDVDHSGAIGSMKTGDILNIGAASATLASAPILNTGVFSLFVTALPVVADSEQLLTITRI